MESGGHRDIVITDYLADSDPDGVLQFIIDWVTADADVARDHVSDHVGGAGTTLVARMDGQSYAKRGYMPGGRGACKGRVPLRLGETVEVDHDLILWLTKDL